MDGKPKVQKRKRTTGPQTRLSKSVIRCTMEAPTIGWQTQSPKRKRTTGPQTRLSKCVIRCTMGAPTIGWQTQSPKTKTNHRATNASQQVCNPLHDGSTNNWMANPKSENENEPQGHIAGTYKHGHKIRTTVSNCCYPSIQNIR